MVCIIQMGKVGSSMATPMLEKQRAPDGEKRGEMLWFSHLLLLFQAGTSESL